MGEIGEIGQDDGRIGADIVLGAELVEGLGNAAGHQVLEQVDDAGAVGEAQHGAHRFRGDRAGAMGDRLIEDRLGVAHRTLGGTRDHAKRGILGLDLLQLSDARQIVLDGDGVDSAQVEALAARQDGDRHLANLGGGEDELHMLRRLLERLQQAVEGLVREHVDFVDDVDLVARRNRAVAHLLDDLADVVDAGMGGGVHLDHVDMAAFHDGFAMLARHGEIDLRPVDRVGLVVERAGKNARGGRLADPAHAGQHPGLGDTAGGERVGQRAHHRLLPDQVGEIARAVFARENAIGRLLGGGVGHGFFSSAMAKRLTRSHRRIARL